MKLKIIQNLTSVHLILSTTVYESFAFRQFRHCLEAVLSVDMLVSTYYSVFYVLGQIRLSASKLLLVALLHLNVDLNEIFERNDYLNDCTLF